MQISAVQFYTLVVENGAMSIAYNDRRPPEPDWEEYGRQAVEFVT